MGVLNSSEISQQQKLPLTEQHLYVNPQNTLSFDFSKMNCDNTKFFVIKSYTEVDVHRSIKYGIWCSTIRGNNRLSKAWNDLKSRDPDENFRVFLFFSVNSSGHFCGMAEMISDVDIEDETSSDIWHEPNNYNTTQPTKPRWKGQFKIKWHYIKDVPNRNFEKFKVVVDYEIRPMSHSRDCTEIASVPTGISVIRFFHEYNQRTSILDDFRHYERLESDEKSYRDSLYVGNNNNFQKYQNRSYYPKNSQNNYSKSYNKIYQKKGNTKPPIQEKLKNIAGQLLQNQNYQHV